MHCMWRVDGKIHLIYHNQVADERVLNASNSVSCLPETLILASAAPNDTTAGEGSNSDLWS